jgi:hypothetical protein
MNINLERRLAALEAATAPVAPSRLFCIQTEGDMTTDEAIAALGLANKTASSIGRLSKCPARK